MDRRKFISTTVKGSALMLAATSGLTAFANEQTVSMPQFIVSSNNGTITEEFRSIKNGWTPSLWGNDYTMSFRPREALVEFLNKCKKHKIRVGLSSWFLQHGTGQNAIFMEEDGLYRAWDETLAFLDSRHLLDDILYVDVLNEYPNNHGYNFAALDYHVWFHHKGGIPGLDDLASVNQGNIDYRMTMKNLQSYWTENKKALTEWMNGKMKDISQTAQKRGIVCGNTEGWGPIFWFDHPELDWSWVKESAETCIDLLQAYPNYKFICTSNFTHPHFKGLWADVKWHKNITNKINVI